MFPLGGGEQGKSQAYQKYAYDKCQHNDKEFDATEILRNVLGCWDDGFLS